METFKNNFNNPEDIDPIPEFMIIDFKEYEKIPMGHYLPPNRSDDHSMKAYIKKIGSNKPYYQYYSRSICKKKCQLSNGISFNFLLNVEGYQTKRMYDVLLSQNKKKLIDGKMIHTDAARYGLWACKGGVPIQRIDDWIEGGRGIGTYTYMHAFVDCDAFDLTANRGSMTNTDWETQDLIKEKINEIWADKDIQRDVRERELWEEYEKRLRSVTEDEKELKSRFSISKTKHFIILPNGIKVPEPSKAKSGYSESETLMLLVNIMDYYPKLFKFKILDYNTNKGIDFVAEQAANPKYIELKGTFQKNINHSFRNVFKFICYDINIKSGDIVEDGEPLNAVLQISKDVTFESPDPMFNEKRYTAYQLIPINPNQFQSMEIIELKSLLKDVVGAIFE